MEDTIVSVPSIPFLISTKHLPLRAKGRCAGSVI
jgi:hypothetical protein